MDRVLRTIRRSHGAAASFARAMGDSMLMVDTEDLKARREATRQKFREADESLTDGQRKRSENDFLQKPKLLKPATARQPLRRDEKLRRQRTKSLLSPCFQA